MKIAITGHTKGIGLAIASAFTNRRDQVLGLSRTSGVVLPRDIESAVHAIEPCDVFVNNYNDDHDTQIRLLYEVARRWDGQHNKHIISIGSRAGECYIRGMIDPYAVYKAAHDAACQQLFNRGDQRPKVTNIRPGYVDPDFVSDKREPTLDPSEVAQAVMWAVEAPFYVSQITLCRQQIRT
jgi:NAD(P)-dependent dehydrogenase (short-subunit alcohol dehydrogenase family)